MRHGRVVTILIGLLLIGACTDGDSGGRDAAPEPATDESTTTTIRVPDEPTGVIVIGHSINTGLNADPDHPDTSAGEYSWATGTASEVRSIYQRLLEVEPQHEGLVANRAANGSTVAELRTQANRALGEVPNPRLVLIATIDNDIRCDGTDADNVAAVGAALAEALAIITEDAPEALVVVMGSAGRLEDHVAMLAADPSLERRGGDGMCDAFDAEGNERPEGLANLNGIISAYEAEMVRVCATFEQCDDAMAAAASVETDRSSFADDLAHPSIEGHKAIAEAVWPRVAEILGLS